MLRQVDERILNISATILLLVVFVLNAQPSAYWRDSAELILSSAYLDIPHPAGFPLYNLLGNIFSLIPIGPIALRINIMSSVATACLLPLSYLIVREILPSSKKNPILTISIIGSGILTCLPIVRQSGTAEVYALNCTLILTLLFIGLRYINSNDIRYGLAATFLGALTLTNHLASIFVIIPCAVLLYLYRPIKQSSTLIAAGVLLILALSLYGYIPTRSNDALPLDTGSPRTLSSLISHMTDARDSALRESSSETDLDKVKKLPALEALFKDLLIDGERFIEQIANFSKLLFIPGIVALLVINKRASLLLLIAAIGAWYPFRGWDPEPWLPIYCLFNIAATIGVLAIVNTFKRASFRSLSKICFASLAIIPLTQDRWTQDLFFLKNYETPAEEGKEILFSATPGSDLITETSWFISSYLYQIEGYRDDLNLVYLPKVIYPNWFGNNQLVNTSSLSDPFQRLGSFIDQRSINREIWIEPSQGINRFISNAATLNRGGVITLIRDQSSVIDSFVGSYVAAADKVRQQVTSTPKQIANDQMHYWESRFNNGADILTQKDLTNQASELLQALCLPILTGKCSDISLNNLSVYLLKQNRRDLARDILKSLLNRGTSQRDTVLKNLTLTE